MIYRTPARICNLFDDSLHSRTPRQPERGPFRGDLVWNAGYLSKSLRPDLPKVPWEFRVDTTKAPPEVQPRRPISAQLCSLPTQTAPRLYYQWGGSMTCLEMRFLCHLLLVRPLTINASSDTYRFYNLSGRLGVFDSTLDVCGYPLAAASTCPGHRGAVFIYLLCRTQN
jgi:hypothetical protein